MTISRAALFATCSMLVSTASFAGERGERATRAGAATAVAESEQPFMKSDKLALWRLHWINHMEIESGTLAQARATSEDVREYGRRLTEEHRRAENRLIELAKAKGFRLHLTEAEYRPVRDQLAKHVAHALDLTHAESGFEKEFLAHMVEDHVAAISLVKAYRERTKDREIRAHLDELLPSLEKHLEEAKSLQSQAGQERRYIRGTEPTPAPTQSDRELHHEKEGPAPQWEQEEDAENRVRPPEEAAEGIPSAPPMPF